MVNMLNIGKKAVAASQKQLEVTAHNIANVNTEGYSRQRVHQEASVVIHDALGNWGTGVDLVRVERMRDLQLDAEFRRFNTNSGYWGTMEKNMVELEKNILETSEYGVSTMINNFFNSWEFLSNNPFSNVHRMEVVDSAQNMINAFKDMYRAIEYKRDEIRHQLIVSADRINQIAEDLANTMQHISLDTAENRPANDLWDKFDMLVDELSGYGNVSVYKRENGTMSVYLGADEIARNNIFNTLSLVEGENAFTGKYEMYLGWDVVGTRLSCLTDGSINALMDLKDKILPGYMQQLDDLVVQIAKQVNDIHSQGYNLANPDHTGADFFNPNVTGVKSFTLSKEVLTDPGFIATSLTGQTGDNQIALMITDLRLSKTFSDQTLTEAFSDIVYCIASDVKMTKMSSERAALLTRQTDNFRESVKGVSINEETANLIKFQQSYQAAAKIISVADEMYRTIINMV